ncbi:MAG: universal stress protein, partial [Burkholderiaceae bacterium]
MAAVFQRLLLMTEHTEFDAGAERVALELANRFQLPLTAVMPLVSNPEYEALAPEVAAGAEREAAIKLTQLREAARAIGVDLDAGVRRGAEPYLEIIDEARERASDLIVIRRRGKRGFLANLLLGEMVSKVVAHAPCSVLIVPRIARMWNQRILVAVEPTGHGKQLVAVAGALAIECALPLTIVSVTGNDPVQHQQADTFIASAMDSARQAGVSTEGHTLVGKPLTMILDAAARS